MSLTDMTGEQLWEAFVQTHPEAASETYDVWCFGGDTADQLAQLTAAGVKTATASAYPLYALEGEELPQPGQYSVILYTNGKAACIIRTSGVQVIPFALVPEQHAWKEGEEDRSLASWRRIHRDFFARELQQAGLTFTEQMPVVCEEFQVVYLP